MKYEAKIVLDGKATERIIEALSSKSSMNEDDTISYTVAFENGVQMDVKVCGADDDLSWTEAVLFTETNAEICCTEPDDEFFGTWSLEHNGDEYIVTVEGTFPKIEDKNIYIFYMTPVSMNFYDAYIVEKTKVTEKMIYGNLIGLTFENLARSSTKTSIRKEKLDTVKIEYDRRYFGRSSSLMQLKVTVSADNFDQAFEKAKKLVKDFWLAEIERVSAFGYSVSDMGTKNNPVTHSAVMKAYSTGTMLVSDRVLRKA